jgi:predicted TIM-barrel fold metal-dependent hydrolase
MFVPRAATYGNVKKYQTQWPLPSGVCTAARSLTRTFTSGTFQLDRTRTSRFIQGGLKGTPACRGASAWLPKDYLADAGNLNITSVVHVETIDEADPVGETKWVAEQFGPHLRCNIVCFVDLEAAAAAETLAAQVAALDDSCCSRVVGVRHILNFEPSWPNVKENLLQSPAFRAGFAKLAGLGLSFDLQVNPHQLEAAAELARAFPSVPVCLNHLGCLKLSGDGTDQGTEDTAAIAVWRAGMAALAKVPTCHVKLSMLPYVLKGFEKDAAKAQLLRSLVLETIELFGAERCMFASNYPVDLNDGTPLDVIYRHFREWVSGLSSAAQRMVFHDTAAKFYKLA